MPADPPPGDLVHPLLAGLREARAAAAPTRFVGALLVPWRAIRFLVGQPRLWRLVVVPVLINIALFVLAFALVLAYVDDAVAWLWAKPAGAGLLGWAMAALWYILLVLFVGLGLVVSYVFVLLLGGIVASPFNDALSERVEAILTGRVKARQPEGSFVGGVLRSIGSTALITGLYVLLMAPLLLLNLVPVLGSVAAALLGGAIGAFFIALEYSDTTFERYGLSLKEKIRLLRANLALAGGFGLGTSLLLWIPLLNFLCIPLAVVGGTALALALTPTAQA